MISANEALKLTKERDDWNLRKILYATIKGETECEVFWGRELTKEELEAKRKEYNNLGYNIVNERVITSWGGDNREELVECRPEYRAVISWNNN